MFLDQCLFNGVANPCLAMPVHGSREVYTPHATLRHGRLVVGGALSIITEFVWTRAFLCHRVMEG